MWPFKPNVKRLAASNDVVGLIGAAGHKDPNVSEAAQESLSRIDPHVSEDTAAYLRSALAEGSPGVRTGAARALGRLGDKQATEALASRIKDESESVRQVVVQALGQIRDERALEPLCSALWDSSLPVRRAARGGLERWPREDALRAFACMKDHVRPDAFVAQVRLLGTKSLSTEQRRRIFVELETEKSRQHDDDVATTLDQVTYPRGGDPYFAAMSTLLGSERSRSRDSRTAALKRLVDKYDLTEDELAAIEQEGRTHHWLEHAEGA